jgi:HK97 gp10 family phage protein
MARNLKTEAIWLTGVKELDDAMERLNKRVRRSTASTAVRNATKRHVLPSAKQDVPFETGALEASLKVRRAKLRGREGRQAIGFSVQDTDYDTFYSRFQEFGTEDIDPEPFLRPAIYENREAVWNTFRAEMTRLLPDAVAKSRRGN